MSYNSAQSDMVGLVKNLLYEGLAPHFIASR